MCSYQQIINNLKICRSLSLALMLSVSTWRESQNSCWEGKVKRITRSSESSGCSRLLSAMDLVFLHNAAILLLCAEHQCSWVISILNMTADKTACLLILTHLTYIQLSFLLHQRKNKPKTKYTVGMLGTNCFIQRWAAIAASCLSHLCIFFNAKRCSSIEYSSH